MTMPAEATGTTEEAHVESHEGTAEPTNDNKPKEDPPQPQRQNHRNQNNQRRQVPPNQGGTTLANAKGAENLQDMKTKMDEQQEKERERRRLEQETEMRLLRTRNWAKMVEIAHRDPALGRRIMGLLDQ